MIASREARTEDCTLSIKGPTKDEPGRYFDVMLRLEDRLALRTKLEIYCTKAWFEWSENEKPRRRSIAIDQRLFEIAQRLLQSGGQESVELIWGLGLARIRPRATGTRFELRASEKLAAERLALTEDAAKRCLRSIEVADSEGASPAPSGRR